MRGPEELLKQATCVSIGENCLQLISCDKNSAQRLSATFLLFLPPPLPGFTNMAVKRGKLAFSPAYYGLLQPSTRVLYFTISLLRQSYRWLFFCCVQEM